MQKGWPLTCFVLYFFSIFIIFMFKITPILLLFFTRQRLNARKCSICQSLACAERKSHKQKLLLLWDNKILKKYLDACIRNNFWNIKITALYIFVDDKSFRHLSVRPLTFLFYPKVFPQKIPVKVEYSFEKFAENVLRGTPIFFAQSTKITDNFFFNWISHYLEIFFPTHKMHFRQPCRKIFDKMTDSVCSSSQIEKSICFQNESLSICSFGHVEGVFENFPKKNLTEERKSDAKYVENDCLYDTQG